MLLYGFVNHLSINKTIKKLTNPNFEICIKMTI